MKCVAPLVRGAGPGYLACVALAALLASGCSRGAEASVRAVDGAGLRAALEAARGKALLLATFATWDGESVESMERVMSASAGLREAGGKLMLLCVDRTGGGTLEAATGAARRVAEKRKLTAEILVWSSPETVELDEAVPLEDEARISALFPLAIAFRPDGNIAGTLAKELSADGLGKLVAGLQN
jgi:hypothetical protein